MSSRRLRSKYRHNRNRRRIEKIKLAAIVLVCGGVIVYVVYLALEHFGHGDFKPMEPPNVIRLGGE